MQGQFPKQLVLNGGSSLQRGRFAHAGGPRLAVVVRVNFCYSDFAGRSLEVEVQRAHGGNPPHQEMKVVGQDDTGVVQQASLRLGAPRALRAVLRGPLVRTLARACSLQQPLLFVAGEKPYQFLFVSLILLQQAHGHLVGDAAQVYFGDGGLDAREGDTGRSDSAM